VSDCCLLKHLEQWLVIHSGENRSQIDEMMKISALFILIFLVPDQHAEGLILIVKQQFPGRHVAPPMDTLSWPGANPMPSAWSGETANAFVVFSLIRPGVEPMIRNKGYYRNMECISALYWLIVEEYWRTIWKITDFIQPQTSYNSVYIESLFYTWFWWVFFMNSLEKWLALLYNHYRFWHKRARGNFKLLTCLFFIQV
jgi:hypothetical protein